MSIRALRLCHHCAVPLSEDDCEHYVFECHACVMSEFDLAEAVRRDPTHPEAYRLTRGAVETGAAPRATLRVISGARAA